MRQQIRYTLILWLFIPATPPAPGSHSRLLIPVLVLFFVSFFSLPPTYHTPCYLLSSSSYFSLSIPSHFFYLLLFLLLLLLSYSPTSPPADSPPRPSRCIREIQKQLRPGLYSVCQPGHALPDQPPGSWPWRPSLFQHAAASPWQTPSLPAGEKR